VLVTFRETLQQFRPDHWAWIHAKLAVLAWAILFLIFTPNRVTSTLASFLATAVSLVVVLGIAMSIVGLYRSFSPSLRKARTGVSLELSGLYLAIAGPLAYCLTQFWLSFGPGGDQRIALTAFAYSNVAFLLVRIVIVLSHRKKNS
jgi:hypothetical protein